MCSALFSFDLEVITMPLDCPHLYDLSVPFGAAVRCKRKLEVEANDVEDCTKVYKKEKLEESSVQHHWWTAKENRLEHTQVHPDHHHGHWHQQGRLEGSLDTAMEIVHNSVPVFDIPPARPSTPPTQILRTNTMEPQKSTSPMMVVEEMPDSSGTGCDRLSSPVGLDEQIEFCSFQCRGAPRSPVSNRIRCSCRGPYNRPEEQHYVSDIY